MQQFQPATHPVASRPPKWLWILPVLSMGLLSVVPPIVIAAKARSSRTWWWAGGLSAAWLAGFTMVGADESDGVVSNIGVSIYFGAWIGAVIFSLVMGPKVAWPSKQTYVPMGPPPPPVYDPNSAAIVGVQDRRQKRHEAREMLSRDPAMARDLRIGRPDLPRQYDDGGLVDVNSAPAEVMAQWLGLTAAQSATVVEARQHLGRFEHPDDLVNLAGLDAAVYDQVKDRVVLM